MQRGKEQSFRSMVLGQLDVHTSKSEAGSLPLTPRTKISSEQTRDINAGAEAMKKQRTLAHTSCS